MIACPLTATRIVVVHQPSTNVEVARLFNLCAPIYPETYLVGLRLSNPQTRFLTLLVVDTGAISAGAVVDQEEVEGGYVTIAENEAAIWTLETETLTEERNGVAIEKETVTA
ncbi:hypothetical protein CFO_g307 [Ceratocystis platani]|uniref:Uncharacterized protein n=1 Tax=Ceratocystis fimbriata f. sp. platani TaxID=88771 RepID=A0A0F8B5H8_CERFI|nr:hypothetical protein CFO_g307 [Ceratocystis platani]